MFSSGRAVRSVCSISANAARGPASTRIAAPPRPFCTHQRRQSSTSCPPDGSKGPNTPQQDAARPSATSAGEGEGRSSRRSSRRKARQAAAIAPPAHEDSGVLYSLPRVPPTHHLQESDVGLSSFFSLHRPISITSSIPTTATEASFNAIFEPREKKNHNFPDVVFTLSNAVEALEGASKSTEEKDLRAEIMQNSVSNSESTKHLDGPKSQISLEQLLAQFRPFRTPPAPVPFDDAEPPVSKRKASQKQRPSEVREAPPARQKRKAWKTTIVVTESTDANGAKTYATTTTPLKEIRDPSLVESSLEQRIIVPKPFLERMRIRQQKWEEYMEDRVGNGASNMLLISVKRQRKLKMKKHKYKKLMRRTRNLRRKLDRT